MKKLFILLVLAFVAFAANAQTNNFSLAKENYISVPTDYTLTNTTVRTFIFDVRGCSWETKQDYLIQIDSLAGNHTNVAVALLGAKFATGSYSAIGSAVNWKGTTIDTTIVISNASATLWNFFKVTVTGTGTGTSKIDAQELKLYNQ